MASRKTHRRNIAFNLAFLDVMSCGFGAAVLLFLIIKHGVTQNPSAETEMARLQEDIAQRQTEIASIETEINTLKEQAGEKQVQLASLQEDIAAAGAETDVVKRATVELSGEIEENRKAMSALEATAEQREKDSAIDIAGQASQQFLTGLSVEGRRIVIMVDHSASMLDEKIINIVRRRTIGGDVALKAPKWVRTRRIAQWLVNKLPQSSMVRFISFSERAQTIPEDRWLRVSDTAQVRDALEKTIDVTPNGGTNLYQGFRGLGTLSPAPDAVYLVTDGLPTMGRRPPRKGTVSGEKRLELFNEAVKSMSRVRARINVILLPLEGDPDAAFAFWQLSRTTGGRLLSPSEKWP